MLLPDMSDKPSILKRFFNEARAAGKIGHRGIVQVLDWGQHEGAAYIVMEYLPGEALSGRLRREPKMREDVVIALAMQMAHPLAAAHAAGIVHRDLKPDNFMLLPEPAAACGLLVKVLDFGIAKLVGDDVDAIRTASKALLGTPAYMSPEQCRGSGGVDHRSDIYSLGCILYEMVTGRRVFQGVTATGELIAAHLSARPPSPRMIDPSISPGLEAIILRMIAKRPEERYQTMHEVHADLERVARGSASLATPHQPADVPTLVPEVAHVPAQSSQPTTLGGVASQAIAPRRARRRPLAIVAGAGLVVAGAGTIAVVAATRDGSNASTSSTAASGDAPADPAPSGVTDAPAVQPSPVASPAPVASIDAGSPAGMPSPAIATPASTPSPAETPPSEARPKDKDAPKRTRPTRTRPTASPTPSPSASPEPPSDDEPLDEHRIK